MPHFLAPFQKLLEAYSNVRQVTQNIDGLQPPSNQIIEAHGRLGLYKCIDEKDFHTDPDEVADDEDRPVHLGNRRKAQRILSLAKRQRTNGVKACPYQYLESLEERHLEPTEVRRAIQLRQFPLSNPPRCSFCNNLVVPQALLFDEGYHSHR